jgi:organic radical activating enzyme
MHPIKEILDKVSSSFCSAKWLQVTLRLQNGHTHSCHHPTAHKIPLSELKKNPAALHNTEHKKRVRQMMLQGKRPSECSYCWKVEDLPGDNISDRYYKSADEWSEPYLKSVAALPWDVNVSPKYLEVSFSNICNFKCAYCFPDVSTKWMSEIKEHGPYPTTDFFGSLIYLKKQKTLPIPENKNPYLKAFWVWLPQVISNLHVLRVTGGEPLLSKDCLRLFKFLHEQPNPKLSLSINTNLGVPSSLVSDMLEQLKSLKQSQKIKEAQIFTSLDTWGKQAEYLRFGLNLELWKKNMELCLQEIETVKINIMVTFNALSVFQFQSFLKYALEQKQKRPENFIVDISILHNPLFLGIQTLGPANLLLLDEALNFMKKNSTNQTGHGFSEYEISKLERIVEFSKTPISPLNLRKRRINFVAYILEYDRRKKTNFLETFPEMKKEFSSWLELYKSRSISKKIGLDILCLGQKWAGRLIN